MSVILNTYVTVLHVHKSCFLVFVAEVTCFTQGVVSGCLSHLVEYVPFYSRYSIHILTLQHIGGLESKSLVSWEKFNNPATIQFQG